MQRLHGGAHRDAAEPLTTDPGFERLDIDAFFRRQMMRESSGNGVGETHANGRITTSAFSIALCRRSAGAAAGGADKTVAVLIQHTLSRAAAWRVIATSASSIQRCFNAKAVRQKVRQQ